MAPVGLLFIAGLLLLTFGQRLLKPVLVVAAVFAGVIIAVRLGHALRPETSPLAWSVAGTFGGVLFVVLFYRLALGLSMGAIAAVASMLLAMAAAETGLVDVGAAPRDRVALAADPSDADHVDAVWAIAAAAAGASAAGQADAIGIPSVSPESAKEAVAAQLDRVSPGLGPSFLAWIDRCQSFVVSVVDWTQERWTSMPRPLRTLLLAAGAAGGFVGFVAGIASPIWAAATVTSLFGALLVLGCGLPLASRVVPPESMPHLSPIGWLGAWLAVALAGWAFQWWNRPTTKSKRAAAAAEPKAA